jgi:hypothetical protein
MEATVLGVVVVVVVVVVPGTVPMLPSGSLRPRLSLYGFFSALREVHQEVQEVQEPLGHTHTAC